MARHTRRPARPRRPKIEVVPARTMLVGSQSMRRVSLGEIVHPDRPLNPLAEMFEFRVTGEDELTENERLADESMGEKDEGWRSCWLVPTRRNALLLFMEDPTDVDIHYQLMSNGDRGKWMTLSGKEVHVDEVHVGRVSRSHRCPNRLAYARVKF